MSWTALILVAAGAMGCAAEAGRTAGSNASVPLREVDSRDRAEGAVWGTDTSAGPLLQPPGSARASTRSSNLEFAPPYIPAIRAWFSFSDRALRAGSNEECFGRHE